MFSVCAVVPVFNHQHAIGDTVRGLRAYDLPVVMVDDGSDEACAAELDRLAAADEDVRLVRLPENGGKGVAVTAGLHAADAAGFTHALQIDADGQHDPADLPRLLEVAWGDPSALVCGRPVFDASIPRSRFYLRYLTHVMVWLNTLSLAIPDSMCGFRVYPLKVVLPVIDKEGPGSRMEFDIEVLVRLNWADVRMNWLPVRVSYPSDGVSHFRLVRDNALITAMHLRLFAGMLRRLPRLLIRNIRSTRSASGVSA